MANRGRRAARPRDTFRPILAAPRTRLIGGHLTQPTGHDADRALRKSLGVRELTASIITITIGGGVFLLPAGVAGALWGFIYLGAWEPAAFDINRSFLLLFMVIIGGLGSILGSFLGAIFITILPLALNQLPALMGLKLSTAFTAHLELMIFGALIVFFLIVEPLGLARLWQIAKEKLRLWPFPH